MPTAVVDPPALATLAADLKTVWTAPSTDARLKKPPRYPAWVAA